MKKTPIGTPSGGIFPAGALMMPIWNMPMPTNLGDAQLHASSASQHRRDQIYVSRPRREVVGCLQFSSPAW